MGCDDFRKWFNRIQTRLKQTQHSFGLAVALGALGAFVSQSHSNGSWPAIASEITDSRALFKILEINRYKSGTMINETDHGIGVASGAEILIVRRKGMPSTIVNCTRNLSVRTRAMSTGSLSG